MFNVSTMEGPVARFVISYLLVYNDSLDVFLIGVGLHYTNGLTTYVNLSI